MIELNKIGLNQVQLNRLYLNTLSSEQRIRSGGGTGDGFPVLPGDVTRWHFGGLTNEMMAAMDDPRIEDADHKGRFLSFKNLAWKGMSGVGGYAVDIDEWGTNSTAAYFERNSIKITATFKENASLGLLYHNIKLRQSCVLKVTGIPKGCDAFLDDRLGNRFYMSEDGVYEIIPSNFLAEALYLSIEKYPERWYGSKLTIEQLPLYPGALVFDGVDDWAGCDNLPLLPKEKGYSIIALRNWITRYDATQYKRPLISNLDTNDEGAFLIEYRKDENVNDVTGSYNSFTDVYIDDNNPITWQTSSSYNGQIIKKGTSKSTNKLCICKTYFGQLSNYANAAIWEIVILDHDATEEELTKIKDYFVKTYPWLFPDQAWTVTGKTNEDEDRATIANITGNGNNLVLSNFGFAEGSGYGLYAENYAGGRWVQSTDRADLTWTSYSVNITSVKVASTQLYYQSYPEQPSFIVPSYKIKVYGLKDGQTLSYRQATSEGQQLYKISEDGTYTLPSFPFKANGDWYGFTLNKVQESCDITIEQIPEYEGYLVTDGADDKIVSSVFGMGKDFTIVGDWKFIDNKKSGTGLVKGSSFYIYNTMIGLDLYINSGSVKNSLDGIKSINAACSDGRAYDRNWNEILANTGNVVGSGGTLEVSSSDGRFDRIAFKNLAIYPRILSKDDCIKAYNYLQTLKAK
ncbi:hypothetical protein PN597_15700 [Parabacteroides merdae]|uniref:hypothetical protein n=1 Tax=Parabacteroides merdae TaxID=46503 RepID=UPI00189BF5F6|nr:hypothetical protein [Parabacteroides merdae]MDB9116758.1 hypothetical protein [Parabacteroides merdae]